ncbi:hypothetical protein T492DRAFT_832242 [Pavlovales sp. CCMP2436]|nr:hypothetical protein T492DRAFT_832242 [Pavlovales sp. CCMP2436]
MEKKSAVIEEPTTVSIDQQHTPPVIERVTVEPTPVTPPASTPPISDTPPHAKPKRIPSEKQKLNYLAANKRRVQILADAKALRMAAADEKAREKAALDEYALAIKLSSKYGFTTPPAPPLPQSAPPVQQAHEASKMEVTPKIEPEDLLNNSTDKVTEETNNISLTIPRFDVDNALGDIPAPLPAQHMFACFLGPPRSGKTSLSTALLTQTSPRLYNGVFDNVWLFVPATSFASMSDSPFKNHDKASLDVVISKLEAASKMKKNSLIIIDDFMSSLKENTLRSALEKLISNRRHLRVGTVDYSQARERPLSFSCFKFAGTGEHPRRVSAA